MIVSELFGRLGLKVDNASWGAGDKRIDLMKRGLEALAVALGTRAILEMIHGVADLADHASKASQILGITTESVQRLGYAASLADVSQEQLEKGLGHLAIGLEEVAKGEGPAADAFHALHLSAASVKGLKLDETLNVVADAFAKMPDGQKKIAAAMGLFGKAGKEMIPFLNGGSKGIKELGKEADDLGIVIAGKTGKEFEEFNDNQKRLSETWRGIKTQIVTALLPALNELVTGAIAWVKANHEVIRSALGKVIEGLAIAVRVLGTVIAWVVDIIGFFTENSDAAAVALGVLGGVITAFALKAAAAWLLALGPMDLFLIIIAAITTAIVYVIKHWDKFGPAVQKVRDRIAAFGEWILDVPGKIARAFDDAWEAIKSGASAAMDYIEGLPGIRHLIALGHIIADPKGSAKGVLDDVRNAVTGAQGVHAAATAPSSNSNALSVVPPGMLAPAGSTPAFTASLGDVHIVVTAPVGADAAALGKIVGDHVAEKQQAMLDQAFAVFRGGVK